jgi:cyclopropane fatty-acyl-phospholipid synthase-like methyltransferase
MRRQLDQLNAAGRARRNVARHYDLNGRPYSLFLDRDLQYSCAYFPSRRMLLHPTIRYRGSANPARFPFGE